MRELLGETEENSVSPMRGSLICLEGKSMTPRRGNTILFRSSQQLPCLRLGPSKGFFELTRRPSRAPNSPQALLPEPQRYKDTGRCVAPGREVPGQSTQTLIVFCKKNFELVTRLGCLQVALAALLNEAGFDSVDRMAMESLTEMASSILNEIGISHQS